VSKFVRRQECGDARRTAQQRLESLLLGGLRGGAATPMKRTDWEEIRAEALKEVEARSESQAK